MKLIIERNNNGQAIVKIEGRNSNVDTIKEMLRIDWSANFLAFNTLSGALQQAIWNITHEDIHNFQYDFRQLHAAANKMAAKEATL